MSVDFLAVLRALHDARVEFLVVGGVAAVLQGAPVHTYDVDVLFSRSRENIDRLLPVLNTVDAYYRMQPERRIVPTASHLASPGHQNLITRFGQFDLLGTVGRDLGYEDLLAHSVEMDIGEGVVVRVLALEKLIEIKEELGQEKDRAVLPILRRTAEAKRRAKSI